MNSINDEEKTKSNRISKIDNEIRSGSYPNSDKLAAMLNVTSRTILRDIEYLRSTYEAPIEYDRNKHGFYYTDRNFFIKNIILREPEYKIITIHGDEFNMFNSDKYTFNLRKAIDKILAAMPEIYTKDIHFSPSDPNKEEFLFEPEIDINLEIPEILESAIKKRKVIKIEYWISNSKKCTLHTLEPLYKFTPGIDHDRLLDYLLAWENENHDKPKVYSVNRIKKVHTTSKHFKIPSNFKISDFVKDAVHVSPHPTTSLYKKIFLFELSFPKEIASEAIERIYYHNQTVEKCKDGTVSVKFRSTQIDDVFLWVLSQGHKVKVLNPPELIEMIKREIRRIIPYYL